MAYRAIIISLDVKLDLKNPFLNGTGLKYIKLQAKLSSQVFHKFLHHSDHHYSLVVVCMCYECSKGCFFLLQNLQLENVETCFATMSCVILSLRQILSLVPTMSEIWTCQKIVFSWTWCINQACFTFLCESERFNSGSSDPSPISSVT